MDDSQKTQAQLLQEVQDLRHQVAHLEEDRRLLRQVIDTLPDYIYVKDNQSRFVLANQAVAFQMGAGHPNELLGKTDFEFYPPQLAQQYQADEQQVILTGIPLLYQEEPGFNTSSGMLGWIRTSKLPYCDTAGHIQGIIGMGHDITRLKQAEEAIIASQMRFRQLIDSLPQNVFGKDLEGRFIITNKMNCLTEGKTEAEILGKTDFDIHPADLAQKYRQDDLFVMQKEQSFETVEDHITDGERRYVQVIKAPMYDDEQKVMGLLGMFWDITEQKASEAQKLQLAIEKEHVRVLGNFIEKTSHEFKTPLTIIGTSIFFLREHCQGVPSERYLGRIQKQVEDLTHLVDGLTTMLRLDGTTQLQQQPLNLANIIYNVKSSVQLEQQHKNIELTLSLAEGMPLVRGDSNELLVALEAILLNAIRYTPTGGQVSIRTFVQAGEVVIAIADTGAGLKPAEIEQIFDHFYRADKAHSTRGIGLGLTIAKRIVELHGGRIEVSSEPKRGSEFSVWLPAG